MDHQTLPVFPLSGFPQLIPALIEQEIMRVNRILAQSAQSELVTCCFDRCRERATVEEIATGLEFCRIHFFAEVSR
jgi:hypothetical protein